MIHRLRHTYLGRLFFYYIIAGVLLVLITVGLILALASASVGGNVRAQTFSGVSAIAAHLDEYLENCREVIRKVAGDGVVARYLARDPGATRYDVARVLHLSDINAGGGFAVHVVRLSDGEISSTGAVSPVFERENYNPDFTMFRRILSAEDVADYKSVRGINMLGDTRLVLGKAVRGEAGEALGLVVVEVSREAFDSVVSGYALPSARSVAVVDPYDVVLFSTGGAEREGLGKLEKDGGYERIWAGGATGGELSPSGTYWAGLGSARLAVVGETSPALVNAVLASASRAVLPVLLAACAIGMLLSYIVARTVSAPISRMTEAMRQVEAGNFHARVSVTSRDEIGRLGAAFNRMQARIVELIRNIEEEQRSLRIAEINALSLQVNPHFLYNTLDLIKWSDKLGQPGEVSRIMVQLGKLLRLLMNNKAEVVALADEMALIGAYLDIQKCRYREKLFIRFDVEEGMETERIPKLTLQPLIENAIVHGLENKPGGGALTVTARRSGDLMRFVVEDDGEGMSPETLESVKELKPNGMYNIGLSNVHQRARLYGDERCGLTIESALGRGTTITLVLKRLEPAEEGAAPCTR